jgi:hypothetical protein
LFANNARNTNGYRVRNLLAYPSSDAYTFGFRYLTANGVRNLTCASFANVANCAARNLLGASFANEAGLADLSCASLAFPAGNAAVNSLCARLAYSAANSYWNLFANCFASNAIYTNFFGFASWNPATTAYCAIWSLAANTVPASWAEFAAASARVEAEASTIANQFAV